MTGYHRSNISSIPEINANLTFDFNDTVNCDRARHFAPDCPQPKKQDGQRAGGYGRSSGSKKPWQAKLDKVVKGTCHTCLTPGHHKAQCRIAKIKIEAKRAYNKKRAAKDGVARFKTMSVSTSQLC
ncbi:MAG: hypothetical protein GY696_23835 [Gammaproteobacteria bacterium]|nr:hypothetical protein [Gammaproteobacteria bacterium]